MPAPSLCPHALRPLAAVISIVSCHRGQEIYGPGDPVDEWYCVVSGLARISAVTAHGRRRIIDFLLPGDFFGMTAQDRHAMAVDVVIDGTRIARLPRRGVEMIANADPEVGRMLREMAFKAVSRLQARILILGRTTAIEKVGAFLVEMSERLPDRSAEVIALPMTRYDIADYLAISVETVSRALTDLKHSGTIRLSGTRQVRIVDRNALAEGSDAGAGSTR